MPAHEQVEILSAVVFTLAFLVHLARSVAGWSAQIGPYSVPMWFSWLAVVVLGYLSWHYWAKISRE